MSTLTADDLTLTDTDWQILFRLAEKQARVRPYWFQRDHEPGSSRQWNARRMADALTSSLLRADRGADRTAHYADVQRMANMTSLSRADMLPACAIDYMETEA